MATGAERGPSAQVRETAGVYCTEQRVRAAKEHLAATPGE
jgi:hypothetical protein